MISIIKVRQWYNNFKKPEEILKILLILSLSILIIVVFSQKIQLSSSDLGRHLENGRLVFENKNLLFNNFYSYTEPEFRFVNHHWLSGVLFYKIYQIGGFNLLSIFNIIIALIIFWLFFYLGKQRSSFFITAALSLPVIFLLSERTEIRPEMLSYLFLGLTWLLLENKTISAKKRLLFLVSIFLLWVNIHIYFFFGLILVFFYLLQKFLLSFPGLKYKDLTKDNFINTLKKVYVDIKHFFLLLVVALINPNHIWGLLYPLNIFRNYGYQIAENKSIFFLQNLMLNFNFGIFKILLFLLILSSVLFWFFAYKKSWADWFFTLFVTILALMAVRNLSIFALVALVIISGNIYQPIKFLENNFQAAERKYKFLNKKYLTPAYLSGLIFLSLLLSSLLLVDSYNNQFFLKEDFGLGVYDSSEKAFSFFIDNNLVGPIFNNYDNGSSLIFGLKNKEKVFVDNRPEAYSVDFFEKEYLPLQQDDSVWRTMIKKYDFKTIFISHIDSTPWGVKFLNSRLKDKEWSLVYFDYYYVILVRNDAYPANFLQERALDVWLFRQKLRSLVVGASLGQRFYLADLARANSQVDLAEEIYRQIILQKPSNVRALSSLAYLYANSDKAADIYKAIDYFQQAVKIEPRMTGLYNQLGLLSWNLLDYNAAEDYWKKALKVRRSDKNAHDYLQQLKDLKKQGLITP